MTEGGAAFESRCPRCGGEFHCGMNQPRPCACASLDLDSALLARLRESYDGCLCTTCLAQLRAPASTSKWKAGPVSRPAGSGAAGAARAGCDDDQSFL